MEHPGLERRPVMPLAPSPTHPRPAPPSALPLRPPSGVLALFLLSAFLTSLVLRSEDLQLLRRTVHIPERGDVTGFTVLSGTNRFCLLPPPRWRASVDSNDHSILLTPRDFSASVTLRIEPLPTNALPALSLADTNALRERVTAQFPDCTINAEFPIPTGEGRAYAFDGERLGKGQVRVAVRHVSLISQDCFVTFVLSAPAAHFDRFAFPFGTLLSSFKRDPPPTPPP